MLPACAGLMRQQYLTAIQRKIRKLFSMCASKDLDASRGYLQYRYGVQNKVELEFPKYLSDSRDQFGYDQYSRPDLSTFVLGFNNDNYRYEISETTEGGDEGVTTRSLLVSSGKGNRASN
jgi:hypothetical protein